MIAVFDSPVGRLAAKYERDVLTSLSFAPTAEILPAEDAFGRELFYQLNEYFIGKRRKFTIPLRLEGTEFRLKVWNALLQIPYGETWSYGELAGFIGRPEAARAVGGANGRNPIMILVPCHRVIAADGSIGGYTGGGPEIKRKLLCMEGVDI